MKTALSVSAVFLALVMFTTVACAKGMSGKDLFMKNCADCHANGGNVINPAYTLHKKDRLKHGVKKAGDIVHLMRNPGPGMHAFSKQAVSDSDAKKIANYILKTFK